VADGGAAGDYEEPDEPEPEFNGIEFEASEVDSPERRGQLPRVLATLVGAGAGAGLIIMLAAWFFGGVAQTEAGFCRLTWAPCTSLSLASVESLSGVDLPDGTEVVSGYAQESANSTVFRADVVLPLGAPAVLSPVYTRLDGDWPDTVPAASDRDLTDLTYWFAGDGVNKIGAAEGLDGSGRTVILFDTRIVN